MKNTKRMLVVLLSLVASAVFGVEPAGNGQQVQPAQETDCQTAEPKVLIELPLTAQEHIQGELRYYVVDGVSYIKSNRDGKVVYVEIAQDKLDSEINDAASEKELNKQIEDGDFDSYDSAVLRSEQLGKDQQVQPAQETDCQTAEPKVLFKLPLSAEEHIQNELRYYVVDGVSYIKSNRDGKVVYVEIDQDKLDAQIKAVASEKELNKQIEDGDFANDDDDDYNRSGGEIIRERRR